MRGNPLLLDKWNKQCQITNGNVSFIYPKILDCPDAAKTGVYGSLLQGAAVTYCGLQAITENCLLTCQYKGARSCPRRCLPSPLEIASGRGWPDHRVR